MLPHGEMRGTWDKLLTSEELDPYVRIFERNAKRGLRGQPRAIRQTKKFRPSCEFSHSALEIICEAEAERATECAKLASGSPIFTGQEFWLPSPSKTSSCLLDPRDPLSKIEALHWLIDTLQSVNERGRSAEFVATKAGAIWCRLADLKIQRQAKLGLWSTDGSSEQWPDNANLTLWDEIDILIRRVEKLPVGETLIFARQFLSQAAWRLVAEALKVDPYDISGPFLDDIVASSRTSSLLASLRVARDKAKHPSKTEEYEVVRYIKFAWECLVCTEGPMRKTLKHCRHFARTISNQFALSLPLDEPLRDRKAPKKVSCRSRQTEILSRVSPLE